MSHFDWTWLVTLASLIGVVANIKKKQWCFFLWAFTNAAWCIVDFSKGLIPQAFLFLVYFFLALWGIYEWRTQKGTQKGTKHAQ